jgi:hypothetical protein
VGIDCAIIFAHRVESLRGAPFSLSSFMPTPPFYYQELLELGTDDTEYRLLTKDHVSVHKFGDKEMLVVDPEALTLLANQAFHDINFFLRPKHLKQVAAILDDPEASENDRMVALTMLKNADVASAGLLPFCQDTGTAIIMGKKGLDRRWRRSRALKGRLSRLHGEQSPLLAKRCAEHVRRKEHRHQSACAARSVCHRRRRV